MFKFLKDKLKQSLSIFSKKVDEEAEELPPQEPKTSKTEEKESLEAQISTEAEELLKDEEETSKDAEEVSKEDDTTEKSEIKDVLERPKAVFEEPKAVLAESEDFSGKDKEVLKEEVSNEVPGLTPVEVPEKAVENISKFSTDVSEPELSKQEKVLPPSLKKKPKQSVTKKDGATPAKRTPPSDETKQADAGGKTSAEKPKEEIRTIAKESSPDKKDSQVDVVPESKQSTEAQEEPVYEEHKAPVQKVEAAEPERKASAESPDEFEEEIEAPVVKKKSFMSKLAEVFTGKKEEVPQEIPPPPITKEEPSLSDEDTEKASKEPEEPKPVHEEEKESITSSVTTQSTATSQPSLQPQATVVHEVEKEAITRAEGATPIVQKEQEPKGFFEKVAQSIVSKKISRQKFDDLFWELEMTLLENNIAVEVIDKIKDDLALELVDKPLPRNKIESTIMETLERSIREVLLEPDEDVMAKIGTKKPFIICFIGINGSGKTTSIAKFAHMLQKQGKSVVLAAADTFRAAAIDQLELHANKLGVKIIKQDYGTDAAAVAFDAIKHAEAKGKDVVLIDTAGRLHSNKNLLAELQKLIRVAKPDMKIFVGESITGNDCVEQAKEFNEAVGIDAIILSKTDIDEKGGAAVSVSYVTKKPIIYIGTGQEYDDLEPFDKNTILKGLGME